MAVAVTTILHTLLRPGDHPLAGDRLYGGTYDLSSGTPSGSAGATPSWTRHGRRPEAARTPRTRVFLVETITNPLMRVARLRELAEFARSHGITSVVDNTFATPVNARPLDLGFDLVFHSATKYLNGHSDLVAGAVMGSAELVDQVRRTLNLYGATLDPHAGFLLARGMKTLALRVRAHNHNAEARSSQRDIPVARSTIPGCPTIRTMLTPASCCAASAAC